MAAHLGPKSPEHEGSSDIYIDVSPQVSSMPAWGDTTWCMFFKLRFRRSSHVLDVEVIDMKTSDLQKRGEWVQAAHFGPTLPTRPYR